MVDIYKEERLRSSGQNLTASDDEEIAAKSMAAAIDNPDVMDIDSMASHMIAFAGELEDEDRANQDHGALADEMMQQLTGDALVGAPMYSPTFGGDDILVRMARKNPDAHPRNLHEILSDMYTLAGIGPEQQLRLDEIQLEKKSIAGKEGIPLPTDAGYSRWWELHKEAAAITNPVIMDLALGGMMKPVGNISKSARKAAEEAAAEFKIASADMQRAKQMKADADTALIIDAQRRASLLKKEGMSHKEKAEAVLEEMAESFNKMETDGILTAAELTGKKAYIRELIGRGKYDKKPTSEAKFIKEYSEHIQKSRLGMPTSVRTMVRNTFAKAGTLLLDRNNITKKLLFKHLGSARGTGGYDAVKGLVMSKGGAVMGRIRMREASNYIFEGLSREDRLDLDELITLNRDRAIKTAHPDYHLGVPGGTASSVDKVIDNFAERVGAEKYELLLDRMQRHSGMMREQLLRMKNAGVIGEEEFEKLVKLDYAPRRWFTKGDELEIDPAVMEWTDKKGNKITVPASGFKGMDQGSFNLVDTDIEFAMNEFFVKTESIMGLNRANQHLRRAAERLPDNGILAIAEKKPSKSEGKDWVRLSVREEGQTQNVWLRQDVAEQWNSGALGHPQSMDVLEWAMGAPIVRFFATGANPFFILNNFPRDMLHAYNVTDSYSSFYPMGRLQQMADVKEVWSDVMNGGPLTQLYFEKGGGTSFLARQGADVSKFLPENRALREGTRGVREMVGALETFNEKAELLVRISAMNRNMKALKASGYAGDIAEEAAYLARNIIDFDQGGSLAKLVDRVAPYLNASIQGPRALVQAGRRSIGKVSFKVAGFMSAMGATNFANKQINSAGWNQVSEHQRTNNFIVMTPLSFTDQDGFTRHLFFKMPIDNTMRPFKMLADTLVNNFTNGYKESDSNFAANLMAAALGGLVPIPRMPPTVEASLRAFSNINTFEGQRVWNGPNVMEEMRVSPDNIQPTGSMAKHISGGMNALTSPDSILRTNPEQIRAAGQALLPANPITEMVNGIYEMATPGSIYPTQTEDAVLEWLRVIPNWQRLIGLTHPLTNQMSDLKRLEMMGESAKYPYVQGINQWSADQRNKGNFKLGQMHKATESLIDFVEQVPDRYKEFARTRMQNTLRLEAYLSSNAKHKGKPVPHDEWLVSRGLPNKATLLSVGNQPPFSRAVYAYDIVGQYQEKSQRIQAYTFITGLWGGGKGTGSSSGKTTQFKKSWALINRKYGDILR